MRNLKKILALALVFAMAFAFTASAATFTDQADIGANYVDDVNMLVELDVIAGYPDGSFGPGNNITRAEQAKMIYTIKYGSDTDGNLFAAQPSSFTDVEGNQNVAWAKGYINYCYNQKIVSGVGNNKFNPSGNITVAEVLKMLLVTLGCDPVKEGFEGANWMTNVVGKAIDLGILNGWNGDPSTLATRELVAKLMRNTIFSSVYTYSAITGIGSQMDALGEDWNMTLGEKTMGLKTVTGIVVANETYGLATDAEGDLLFPTIDEDEDAEEGETLYVGSAINATGVDSNESVILYEAQSTNGTYYNATLTIDRALPDEMLGNKVNIFFKADRIENNGRYDYKNIEVLGDVLVHSDTVSYTLPAIATDVMPDGDSTSETEIQPYITFTVDGVEKTIKSDRDVDKVKRNEDAQGVGQVIESYNRFGYIFNTDVADDDADITYCGNGDYNFIAEMGLPVLSKYRFVSVDGGRTFAYMFKVVSDGTTTANYGSVNNYSESKGTISITNVGSVDLDECVINGEIATDDLVVYYRDNGKLVIEKVEAITGAVESFTDDGGVVIGGNTYYAWMNIDDVPVDENGVPNLFDYYMENKSAQGANTTYYVYENLIMEIVADEVISADTTYGVVLRSYYDADMDTAYVKLGFADNTEGTYQVGKTYLANSREPNSDANNYNRPQDFADNQLFGIVVKYKVRDNGTLDLSQQDFADIFTASNDTTTKYFAGEDAAVDEAQLQVDGEAPYYGLNDGTVLFVLYGNPNYYVTEDDEVKMDATADDYAPVKAKAYKLSELKALSAAGIDDLYIGKMPESGPVVSYILNSKTSTSKYIVAAAMTIGESIDASDIAYKDSRALAYVVSAYQYYNGETDSYYATFNLINETGAFTATTIENVTDLNAVEILDNNVIGNISDVRKENCKFPAGTFIRYDINAEGVITAVDNDGCGAESGDIQTAYTAGANQGFFLVNVVGERNGVLTFYNTNVALENLEAGTAMSCKYHEDGYDIIAIDEDSYVGSALTKLSSRAEDLEANRGNAIIELEEGKIIRVFSFIDGRSLN